METTSQPISGMVAAEPVARLFESCEGACPNCGKRPFNNLFCPRCGYNVTSPDNRRHRLELYGMLPDPRWLAR
ncbi:MAG: hypothetical protein AAB767_01105 [Patescibacteria group bacterium]